MLSLVFFTMSKWPLTKHSQLELGLMWERWVWTDMSTAPPQRSIWGGGVQLSLSTAQTCLLHQNVIFLKMRKFSGGLLKVSLIFKKFYNIMKNKIKIFLLGSWACENFFDQSCSPLDAEHRYVHGLVKWPLLSELFTFEYWRLLAHLKPSVMHVQPWPEDKNPPNILALF